jgi:hypothetical protein
MGKKSEWGSEEGVTCFPWLPALLSDNGLEDCFSHAALAITRGRGFFIAFR